LCSKLLGGVYEISKKTSHIICKDSIDEKKMEYYKNKYNLGIIYVKIEWLLECIIEGYVVNEEKFLITSNENANVIDSSNINNSNENI
jgi:hypothetical protein